MRQGNPIAKDLRVSGKYNMRVVGAKTGKGSFKRKEKHTKGVYQYEV